MSGIEGGKYDEVARALGNVLSQKGGVDIEIKTSSGSRENLTALEQGKADLALLQNDISSAESVHSITILYEEALHLIVRNDFNNWCSLNRNQKYVILESAIIFETGLNKKLDLIITVFSPEELRGLHLLKHP